MLIDGILMVQVHNDASVAQGIERLTTDQKVEGSIPSWGATQHENRWCSTGWQRLECSAERSRESDARVRIPLPLGLRRMVGSMRLSV